MPLFWDSSAGSDVSVTFSNGDRTVTFTDASATNHYRVRSNFTLPATGKYYWEIEKVFGPPPIQSATHYGIFPGTVSGTNHVLTDDPSYGVGHDNEGDNNFDQFEDGTASNFGAPALWAITTADEESLLCFAYDADNGRLWYGVAVSTSEGAYNGSVAWYDSTGATGTADPGTATDPTWSSMPASTFYIGVSSAGEAPDVGITSRFLESEWVFGPPSGFSELPLPPALDAEQEFALELAAQLRDTVARGDANSEFALELDAQLRDATVHATADSAFALELTAILRQAITRADASNEFSLELFAQLVTYNEAAITWDTSFSPVEMVGTLTAGQTMSGDFALGAPTLVAIAEPASVFELPLPELEATVLTGEISTYIDALAAPVWTSQLNAVNLLTAAWNLSPIALAGTGLTGTVSTFAPNLPFLSLEITGHAGQLSTFAGTLARLRETGQLATGAISTFTGQLPGLTLVITGDGAALATFLGWALEMETGRLARYTSFPVTAVGYLGNVPIAVTADGLQMLSGNTDDGANIASILKFGKADLNIGAQKRVPTAFAGLEGQGKLTIQVDDSDEYSYPFAQSKILGVDSQIAKLGRGLKGRYWQLGFTNTDGADFSLDMLEIVEVASRRRIS